MKIFTKFLALIFTFCRLTLDNNIAVINSKELRSLMVTDNLNEAAILFILSTWTPFNWTG